MSDLSPQAKGLLSRVAKGDGPSNADRQRVLGLVTAVTSSGAAAAGAGVSGAAAAGAGGVAATTTTVKLVVTLALFTGIGASVTVGGTSLWRAHQNVSRPTAQSLEVARRAPSPASLPGAAEVAEVVSVGAPDLTPVAEVQPEPEASTEGTAPPKRPGLAEPSAKRTPIAAPPGVTPDLPVAPPSPSGVEEDFCALARELAVVQVAQKGLNDNALAALAQLDAFEQRCATGVLGEERLATRALLLCSLGRFAAGRDAVEQLARQFPASPSMPRVNQSCGQ